MLDDAIALLLVKPRGRTWLIAKGVGDEFPDQLRTVEVTRAACTAVYGCRQGVDGVTLVGVI